MHPDSVNLSLNERSPHLFSVLQVAQRYWNAHAFVNMAVWLQLDENANDPVGAPSIADARIAVGLPSVLLSRQGVLGA